MSRKKEKFAVAGLSAFGYQVAVRLFKDGSEVIAVDKNEGLVKRISPEVTLAVCADATDWEVMEHIGAFDVDAVVIGFRSTFDGAVLLTHYLKKNTQVTRVIAQVDTPRKAEALRMLGADFVVIPEIDTAERVVNQLTTPNLVEHLAVSEETAIVEIPAPPAFIGRSLVELQIRGRYLVYVVGIKRSSGAGREPEVLVAPAADTRFEAGDTMLLLGSRRNLRRFTRTVEEG